MDDTTYMLDLEHKHFHLYHEYSDAEEACKKLIEDLPDGDWQYNIRNSFGMKDKFETVIFNRELGVQLYPADHVYFVCAPLPTNLFSSFEPFFTVEATDAKLALRLCIVALDSLSTTQENQ